MANGTDDSRLGSMSSDDEDFEDIEDEEMRSTHTDDAHLPDDLPDMANVGWMEVDEEFQEWIGSDTDWLGSDDDDDDENGDDEDYPEGPGDDSALSNNSLDRNNNGKRSRGSTPPTEGHEDDIAAPESRLKKRLKTSKERHTTVLRSVEVPASNPNSASPSPRSSGTTLDGTSEERGEDGDEEQDEGGEEEEEEEEEDDLAAEFEREFLAMEALDEELAAQGQQTENDGGGNGNGNGNGDSAAAADGDVS